GFLDAVAARVMEALRRFPPRSGVQVIFTAHSLPQRILAQGDPYPDQLRVSAAAVGRLAGLPQWHFAYQSAGATPEPWLGPEVGDVLAQLAGAGHREFLIVPIGFVSDHVEILYDVDVMYRHQAERLGARLERTASLNDDPRLIGALADLARPAPLARGSLLWNGKELAPLAEGQAAALLGIEGQTGVDVSQGFRSFRGGMGDVVEALLARLGSAVRTGMGVTAIAPSRRGYRLSLAGGSVVEAEGVVLALPAWAAARLVAALGVVAARCLEDVLYYPSVTVSLAYERNGLTGKLSGTGFVSAGESGTPVRACTYASFKYPGRAPGGYALLRAFVVPPDGDPASVAHAELAKILGVTGAPLWSRAFHWTRGVPRYKPQHA